MWEYGNSTMRISNEIMHNHYITTPSVLKKGEQMNEYEKKKDAQKTINYILLKRVISNLDELEDDMRGEREVNPHAYRVGLNKLILEKVIQQIKV